MKDADFDESALIDRVLTKVGYRDIFVEKVVGSYFLTILVLRLRSHSIYKAIGTSATLCFSVDLFDYKAQNGEKLPMASGFCANKVNKGVEDSLAARSEPNNFLELKNV
ncbi:hypothetical protein HC931_28395 [Candidatus Gracilibacteria bacterium]|nr:hypothetical protein [Candidatus Gracilibacteria bacterium]